MSWSSPSRWAGPMRRALSDRSGAEILASSALSTTDLHTAAVDLDRQGMRTFRLDRIESIEPVGDAWPEQLPPHERVVAGTAQVVATRAAAAMLADYATSDPVSIDGERVRLDIEVWSEPSVLRAVAACGGDAEIVAPASLRRAMHRFAVEALRGAEDGADGADGAQPA